MIDEDDIIFIKELFWDEDNYKPTRKRKLSISSKINVPNKKIKLDIKIKEEGFLYCIYTNNRCKIGRTKDIKKRLISGYSPGTTIGCILKVFGYIKVEKDLKKHLDKIFDKNRKEFYIGNPDEILLEFNKFVTKYLTNWNINECNLKNKCAVDKNGYHQTI